MSCLNDYDVSKVYINLIDQKEPTLNFNLSENKKEVAQFNNNSYCKKVVQLNNEEIQLHKEYLKANLKKNFFN